MACSNLAKEDIQYLAYGIIEILVALGISIAFPKVGQLWYCGAMYGCGCTWSFHGGVKRCNIEEWLNPDTDTISNPNYGKPFCPWCMAKGFKLWLVTPDPLIIIMFFSYLAVTCYQWRERLKWFYGQLKSLCNKNKEPSEVDMAEITTNNHNNNGVNDYHPNTMEDLMKEDEKAKYYTKLICKAFWSRIMVPFYAFFIYDTIMGFIYWRASDYPHWFGIDR